MSKPYFIVYGPPRAKGSPRKAPMLKGYFKLQPDDIIERGDLLPMNNKWQETSGYMVGSSVCYGTYIRKGRRSIKPPQTRPNSRANLAIYKMSKMGQEDDLCV